MDIQGWRHAGRKPCFGVLTTSLLQHSPSMGLEGAVCQGAGVSCRAAAGQLPHTSSVRKKSDTRATAAGE